MKRFNINIQGFGRLYSQWLTDKLHNELDIQGENMIEATEPLNTEQAGFCHITLLYCLRLESLHNHPSLKGSQKESRLILWWGGNLPAQDVVIRALNLGVSAIVNDAMEWEDILSAVKGVMKKEIHFNEIVSEALFNYCRRNRVLHTRRYPVSGQICERERKVIQLRRAGKTSREIAGLLFLSKKTIDKVFGDLYRRFDCNNFFELLNAFENVPVHDSAVEGVPDLNSLR
jgi:DNA-binding CsgD family transcriptional regulator